MTDQNDLSQAHPGTFHHEEEGKSEYQCQWVKLVQRLDVRKPQYSAKVDHHIYLHPFEGGCSTPDEWVELALAALDQAGLTVDQQEQVQKLVDGMNF